MGYLFLQFFHILWVLLGYGEIGEWSVDSVGDGGIKRWRSNLVLFAHLVSQFDFLEKSISVYITYGTFEKELCGERSN